ncbi:aminopeptidase N C-terminal domain-containing protein, partial [Enterococcus innesii]|uniref:aminopeptidase N C-terminal domain-containing protein n=1 Tax=Enterococcus innesii TaxID=2839759 RepID=UPI003D10137E
ELRDDLLAVYRAHQTPGAYSPDAASAGHRALKNVALSYLAELDDGEAMALAQQQDQDANNMTDRLAALSAVLNSAAPGKSE